MPSGLLDDLNRLADVARAGNVNLQPRSNERRGRNASRTVCHQSSDFLQSHYDVVSDIGRGSFSRVRLVREKRSGQERVCKVVCTKEMSPGVLALSRNEIRVLSDLDHPHIVKLYEYADDPVKQELVLILEYLGGGDCSELVASSPGTMTEVRVARLVHQLLVAVNVCHIRGIMHRDIKPQNMMLTSSEKAWGTKNCKIIDFGLSECMQSSHDFVGTPAFMAPELLIGAHEYTSKVDLWSIACTTIELLTGAPPFGTPEDFGGDMEPVFENIRNYREFADVAPNLEELTNWTSRSSDAKDFVQRLLRVDPNGRPTAEQALSHPWMEKNRPAQTKLTADMMHSMQDYANSPLPLRCSLLVVAARTGGPDLARIGTSFTGVDTDDDGWITHEDLTEELANGPNCGWSSPGFNVSRIIESAGTEKKGALSYTEFIAACIHGRYTSVDQLATHTFNALDDDRDGLVDIDQIRPFFNEQAINALIKLPQDRPFSARDWKVCLHACGKAGSLASSSDASASVSSRSFSESGLNGSHPVPTSSIFGGLLGLQCGTCDNCEEYRDGDDEMRMHTRKRA